MPARLATNRLGSSDMPEASSDPPEMSTAAQFMYISRLPTLLNHVQASVAWPFCKPSGRVKLNWLRQSYSFAYPLSHWNTPLYEPRGPVYCPSKFMGELVGQPPSMLYRTFQL